MKSATLFSLIGNIYFQNDNSVKRTFHPWSVFELVIERCFYHYNIACKKTKKRRRQKPTSINNMTSKPIGMFQLLDSISSTKCSSLFMIIHN